MSPHRSLGPRRPVLCRAIAGSGGGFTLIELLVVITIIAVLFGLLFPAFQGIQERAKKTQAKSDLAQIVTSVTAYYTDYGKYPIADIKQGCDTLCGNPNGTYDNALIFNTLRAISDSDWNANNALNPKQVVYFQGTQAQDTTHPKAGFAGINTTSANNSTVKKGGLMDPWGNEYLLTVDGDYDGWSMDFIPYSDVTYASQRTSACAGTFSAVSVNVLAVSWGKDGQQGNKGNGKYSRSDDVLSWQ
jgi:prepilin-type N-terminal cleavage/methylation domain-containing protein